MVNYNEFDFHLFRDNAFYVDGGDRAYLYTFAVFRKSGKVR